MLKPPSNAACFFLVTGIFALLAGCHPSPPATTATSGDAPAAHDAASVKQFVTEYLTKAKKDGITDDHYACQGAFPGHLSGLTQFEITNTKWDKETGGEANVTVTFKSINKVLKTTISVADTSHDLRLENGQTTPATPGLCVTQLK